jgi:hypothetical protein
MVAGTGSASSEYADRLGELNSTGKGETGSPFSLLARRQFSATIFAPSNGFSFFEGLCWVGVPRHRHPQLGEHEMQEHSVFVADCLCGRPFESLTREYVCPACGRHIMLDWRHEPETGPEGVIEESSAEAAA